MTRVADAIDKLLNGVGLVTAWLMPVLMIAIVLQVIMRYGFDVTSVKLEELQWHFYAVAMVLGISYAFGRDAHIRVDVLHHRFSKRTKAAIDAVGIVVLLMPFVAFLFWHSLPFIRSAWSVGERSNAPSGLPWRWLIKSVIPLGCVLILLAALSRFLRCIATLRSE
ncbi:MAG: C4-dicarboxylate ABC transporter [Phycisphaeraceae bacterium]|nr:C4-dicarboxylate ABC transporter [Phycisphaeraceae bacterium]